jgi:hypothetical protein
MSLPCSGPLGHTVKTTATTAVIFPVVFVLVLFSRFVSMYREQTKERGIRARSILAYIADRAESREKISRTLCKHAPWLVP